MVSANIPVRSALPAPRHAILHGADDLALACEDVLSDGFLASLSRHGIETLPVSYKEARKLGCNVLALGRKRIFSSADNTRVNQLLRARGFDVGALEISQFTNCGGGIHCLTMPINRVPPQAESSVVRDWGGV
jgi:arginine deiminase